MGLKYYRRKVLSGSGLVLLGRVGFVFDGDTLRVRVGIGGVVVRIWGIDAPEAGQFFFWGARDLLCRLVGGRNVVLRVEGRDRWGRLVCRVSVASVGDVGLAMVREGGAWWYRGWARGASGLRVAQRAAVARRVGLWAERGAVAPWLWRKRGEFRNKQGRRG